jgi:hypothetical protein
LIWNGGDDEATGSLTNQDLNVKQEFSVEEQKIKDEPSDDFNIDLFENIDTILEENLGGSRESNTLAGILNNGKKEESSDISDSGSEYEEVNERKRRTKSSKKRSSDFRDFDMG